MSLIFKHSLRFAAFLLFFGVFSHVLMAQEVKVQAAPPIEVQEEVLAPLDPKGLVVVELFSSQACMFCPKADEYLDELAEKDNVIALACHVDYFDVKQGSLAKPFCTQRQTQYGRTLRSGPKYTPQMVLNGNHDAIGHKRDKVVHALHKVASDEIAEISIDPVAQGNKYRLSMPNIEAGQYAIWVALIDKPQTRKISQGVNRGQDVVYKNIVSAMDSPLLWGGEEKQLDLSAKKSQSTQSVVVFAQNPINGHIVAAGRFRE